MKKNKKIKAGREKKETCETGTSRDSQKEGGSREESKSTKEAINRRCRGP